MSIPATKNGMPPIHPGELLREILHDLDMSQAAFARMIGVSPMRISHIVRGERPVTAALALRFGRAFGQTPEMWTGRSEERRVGKECVSTGRSRRSQDP